MKERKEERERERERFIAKFTFIGKHRFECFFIICLDQVVSFRGGQFGDSYVLSGMEMQRKECLLPIRLF